MKIENYINYLEVLIILTDTNKMPFRYTKLQAIADSTLDKGLRKRLLPAIEWIQSEFESDVFPEPLVTISTIMGMPGFEFHECLNEQPDQNLAGQATNTFVKLTNYCYKRYIKHKDTFVNRKEMQAA
ncbi:MAG: hypothetical protein H9535_12845 [Ignavibacteria bacterium]|nr:hypothetical protein [Ignavibacteria bacterium]